MESFEELGLPPELSDALASHGIEEPTPFQVDAIPVIRRGNHLLGRAGPGAGTLVAYVAGLLARLEPGGGSPRALVIAPTAAAADGLAESAATLGAATGHSVASIGAPWVLPERADLLFGTAPELLAWARAGTFRSEEVQAVVVDQASTIERATGLADLESLLEFLPKDAQRVVLALPATDAVEDFVTRHARRAVQLPPRAVDAEPQAGPRRGEVRYRIVEEPREAGTLQLVSELLEETRHLCLFFSSEDEAADVGDYLTLHGYRAGAPGDGDAPVWLAAGGSAGELHARAEGAEALAVSFGPPAGPDSLDRRHGGGRGGVVVVLPREMAHLRDVAKRTGYRVVPFPPAPASGPRGEVEALLARLDAAADQDLAPWLVALEPIFARRGAAEVAAAAVALLRERAASAAAEPQAGADARAATSAAGKRSASASPAVPPAFVRLFVSLGERDGAGPGDLVGAITGEAGVQGNQVGKIEVRDTFSLVEVQEPVAERVIRALNGITVRGRSVRADYDRGMPSGGRRGGSERGPRKGGGAPGERSGPPSGPRSGPRPGTKPRGGPARPRRDRD